MLRNDPPQHTPDLFADDTPPCPWVERIGPDSVVLRHFALPMADELLAAISAIQAQAPFRHLVTPGGFTMSVALTNCGTLGWTSDRTGYRYTRRDPLSGEPWPAMPGLFLQLAERAAAEAGFAGFQPDACLINRYVPDSRLTLHQDKDERGLAAPIVSVSLGVPAIFQFGGFERNDKTQRIPLQHGDVVVWGGVDRLRYHGILPLKESWHPQLGNLRINFTFRKAG